MKEILDKIFNTLDGFLPSVSVSVKLGVIGGILLLILFLICLAIGGSSKIAKYTKLLLAGSRKFAVMEPITDENVDVVYDELKKHPEPVSTGWTAFMEQRVGAPSDYFPAKTVLSAREFSGKRTAGKSLFAIFGAVIWMIVGLLGYYFYAQHDGTSLSSGTFVSVVLMLEFLIIPIGLYIIFLLSLGIDVDKKVRRLSFSYASFCEILDERVVVTDREADAFVTDNLAEINKRVQELVAGRSEDEIIDVITVPKTVEPDLSAFPSVGEMLKNMGIEDELEVAEEEEEPVEEPVPEVTAQPEPEPEETEEELTPEEAEKYDFLKDALHNEDFVRFALENEDVILELIDRSQEPEEPQEAPVDLSQMTEEETYEWVESILQICELALHDENTSPDDLDEMGVLMDETLAVLDDPTCRAALTDYLGKLADKYYSIVEA